MKTVLLISRDEVFSPNSVEKDKAILEAVGGRLTERGMIVTTIAESAFTAAHSADVYMSMGRLPSTLALLKEKETAGGIVINSGFAVERCARGIVDSLMRSNNIPAAPLYVRERAGRKGSSPRTCGGIWLKRADACAQTKADVRYAEDAAEAEKELRAFHVRGVYDVLVTEHVRGDVVKFYGVSGTDFFRVYYPTDDGQTKFGDENVNGTAHHYVFSTAHLHRDADKTARLTGVKVYGGDCIVRSNGSYAIIDFNDWPSFSRCKDEAAEAIASLAEN